MARRRQTKWAKAIMLRLFSDPLAPELSTEDKEYVQLLVEGLQPLVNQQGERASVAALEMGNLILANMISRRADFEALKDLSKEKLEMAIKAREHTRKTNAAAGGVAPSAAQKQPVGLGTRLRALMKKTEGAAEEAIALTEQRRRMREETEGPE